jgi:hypothetical protein
MRVLPSEHYPFTEVEVCDLSPPPNPVSRDPSGLGHRDRDVTQEVGATGQTVTTVTGMVRAPTSALRSSGSLVSS